MPSADSNLAGLQPGDILAFIPFLARNEVYKTEKPYGADFPVDHIDGAKITNHDIEIHPVRVRDIRNRAEDLNLDENGAFLIKAKTSLCAADASDSSTPAMKRYSAEVLALLQQNCPEYVEIRFMDFQVRKRSLAFPYGVGEKVEFAQPASLPHTDFSVDGAFARMTDVFPEQNHAFSNRRFDLLNIWRVLKGPNDDWPLAVCDYASVDWDNDTTTNDAIHLERVGENWLLHHNDAHKWYYLSGMEEDDLLIFRNTDSEGRRSRCFHAAFHNPIATCAPRESVELRVVAFRD